MIWRPAVMAIAAVAVVAIAIGSLLMRPSPVDVTPSSAATSVAGVEPGFDMTIDTNAEVWEVLTAAAADMEWDEAREAGMGLQPAAVDHAVQRLNADELHELGRLLRSELGMAGD